MTFRPSETITLAPGQESVWDYPRPPRIEPTDRHITVECNGVLIAETRQAIRILETSHPPTYYIPPEDVRVQYLALEDYTTYCEWKGLARYYALRVGDRVINSAAWCYPEPNADYATIQHHIAFYPSRVDRCTVNGEVVAAQPGDFYGGWITGEIVGPFKGDPGTQRW